MRGRVINVFVGAFPVLQVPVSSSADAFLDMMSGALVEGLLGKFGTFLKLVEKVGAGGILLGGLVELVLDGCHLLISIGDLPLEGAREVGFGGGGRGGGCLIVRRSWFWISW
jgi:hypothetical protein